MASSPYKKDWLARTGIARGLLSCEAGTRLPTINEYCEAFDCSRGVVQHALAHLEGCGAATLTRRGKQGTYLAAKNEELLFENAGLQFLTGSMPTPLNMHLAGMATGICQAMGRCSIPFTFAFVQGGRNRMDALRREVYDFVVVTRATAEGYMAEHPEVEEAFPLAGCEYSPPYLLYINRPAATGLTDGMTVAVDPASHDQWQLTQALCAGKQVELVEMPYIPSIQAFFAGEVDCVVSRDDGASARTLFLNSPLPGTMRREAAGASIVPIGPEITRGMQQPVVLVNRRSYGMAGILKTYLGGDLVSYIQNQVISQQMAPQFF